MSVVVNRQDAYLTSAWLQACLCGTAAAQFSAARSRQCKQPQSYPTDLDEGIVHRRAWNKGGSVRQDLNADAREQLIVLEPRRLRREGAIGVGLDVNAGAHLSHVPHARHMPIHE